jgi:hypothetical protein
MALPRMCLLVLAAACACRASEPEPERRTPVALLKGLSGTVDVSRAGSVDWVRAHRGAALFEDDRLRTFKGAFADLLFDGGSVLKVEEESLISLGAGVTVERGAVAGELHAGLKLMTPALEAEASPVRDIVIQ